MAIGVLIIGESGTGKSTSVRNLNPDETFIIQVVNKPLPFPKFNKIYPLFNKGNKKGNRIVTANYQTIAKILKSIDMSDKYKNIIIDDSTYLIAKQYLESNAKGYDKFIGLLENFYHLVNAIEHLEREDLKVIMLGHQKENENGKMAFKTIGKAIDDKITLEGLFSIVLNTEIRDNEYCFRTQNNGYNTSKSPLGMFESEYIENDLKLVVDKINEYYGINTENKEKKEDKGE
ncbi:AAA family ATPase [Streptobacillus moniliformis]|uniref:AAA family ATPase n=1 Tax=Streptobacillus moniliformis TaxID=34105 RepID=UPI0007E485D0|nr:AAA family ATPase [Streptobacillus moniliformis]